MKFYTSLLINNFQLFQQIKLRYGFNKLNDYPYYIFLDLNNQKIEFFSINILYNLFPEELENDIDRLSFNNLNKYMNSYNFINSYTNSNIYLHNIDELTKTQIKDTLITTSDDNKRYKIYDLIEDEHYILSFSILAHYDIYVYYLNGKYILLTKYEQVHEYLLSLEAKDLLQQI